MSIVMDSDGRVRPFRVSDLKEVAERDRRIEQLERLSATLAAQVDRQALVLVAVRRWEANDKASTRNGVRAALAAYDAAMAAPGKGGDG